MVLRWMILSLALTIALGGCMGNRCSKHQRFYKGSCLCEDGYEVTSDFRCVKAGQDDDSGTGGKGDGGSTAMSPPGDSCDPVTALGCQCQSDADCAGKKADYCVLDDPSTPGDFRVCLIQGCDVATGGCPSGLKCCSFFLAPKGTVCLPKEVECPFG